MLLRSLGAATSVLLIFSLILLNSLQPYSAHAAPSQLQPIAPPTTPQTYVDNRGFHFKSDTVFDRIKNKFKDVGDKIDDSVDKVKRKIDASVDKFKDKVDDVHDKIDDSVDKVKDKFEDARDKI